MVDKLTHKAYLVNIRLIGLLSRLAFSLLMINRLKAIHSLHRNLKTTETIISRLYTSQLHFLK